MSENHLNELRRALERKGWRIRTEHEGNDRDVSATWDLERSPGVRTACIQFEGLADLTVLPISRSYACRVQGREGLSLYFGRIGFRGSRRRRLWTRDVGAFVSRLEDLQVSLGERSPDLPSDRRGSPYLDDLRISND